MIGNIDYFVMKILYILTSFISKISMTSESCRNVGMQITSKWTESQHALGQRLWVISKNNIKLMSST